MGSGEGNWPAGEEQTRIPGPVGVRLGSLFSGIHSRCSESMPSTGTTTLNVLILYSTQAVFTGTVTDHLASFRRFSRHNYYYADAVLNASCNIDLDIFDAVIVHYSCGLYLPRYFSREFEAALKRFSGLKIIFAQDEYDNTEVLRQRIEDLGAQLFFTCVPKEYIGNVYPSERFPHVEFVHTLTGYVPLACDSNDYHRPLAARRLLIGYRGRPLHFKYGNLGQEKINIGRRVREICLERGLPVDIEWDEESRIYWDQWYQFLGNCRATLGTESGSNVFDFDGSLRMAIDHELARNPHATYADIYVEYLAEHEGRVAIMNQISPRVFEAVACRTALVLFEGSYSGVVRPEEHYIPLKKDFSNVDDVLDKLQNDEYLGALTERAYNDIVASEKYSYRTFIDTFDKILQRHIRVGRGNVIISSVVAAHTSQTPWTIFPEDDKGLWAQQIDDYTNNRLRVYPLDRSLINTATSVPLYMAEQQVLQVSAGELAARAKDPGGPLAAPRIKTDRNTPARMKVHGQFRLEGSLRSLVDTIVPLWVRLPPRMRKLMRGSAHRVLGFLSK